MRYQTEFVFCLLLIFVMTQLPTRADAQLPLIYSDFSNGLSGWSAVVLNTGNYPGYPKWGTHVDVARGNPSAFLDVPGGAFGYLESEYFFMPDVGILDITVWGHHDPVVLGIQVSVRDGPVYVIDDIDPPKIDLGQAPATKQYALGDNVAGRYMAVRLACRSEPSYVVGTFCDYDDVTITAGNQATSYPVLHGEFVDVDWSVFSGPEVAVWAQRTADAQYLNLARVQGIQSEHMRKSPIHLDWGVGGWADNGEVGIRVDWFFGKSLADPPSQVTVRG